jgi:DNA polymerase elongation subunit (family B)
MLEKIDLKNVLVLDIETVPQYPSYEMMPDKWKMLWTKKVQYQLKENNTPADLYGRAGIYSEFGRIICISAGCFDRNEDGYKLRLKSYYGDNESSLLTDFNAMLDENYSGEEKTLCAHNGREFDYPYISRRCLVNNIRLPWVLNNHGKKPWEVTLLDTMELWKSGDHKNYTSLELLAAVFDIQSPKDDINGEDIGRVYWEEKNIERIKNYCQKDVITVACILLKYKGLPVLEEKNVIITN